MRKIWKVTAAAAALTLGLSACSASEPAAPTRTTLNVAMRAEPTSFVPALGTGDELSTLYLVYDRLIDFDPQTGELLPDAGIASEWGFDDDSGTSFSMTIKDGITFQDGTPLDAEAVAQSLDYTRNARTIQPLATSDLDDVTDVRAVGDKVEITLDKPFSPLPTILTGRAGLVVSPTAIEKYGEDAGLHDAGSGPYRVVTWDQGVSWTLERSDSYWGDPGAFEKIQFSFIADADARLNAFRAGQVDFIWDIDPIEYTSLQSDSAVRVQLEKNLRVSSVAMIQSGPWADPRVRQALNLAIDRESLARAVFPTLPDAAKDYPSNLPVPTWNWAATEAPGIKFDPDQSRKLLADAGYGNGLPFLLCVVATDVVANTTAEILRTQLADVGIQLNVVTQPTFAPCNEGARAGKYDGGFGTMTGNIDPHTAYTFEITVAALGGTYPTIQAGLDKVAAATTRDEQIGIYGDINDEWQKVVPVTLVFSRPLLVGYNAELKGSAESYEGIPRLRNISF